MPLYKFYRIVPKDVSKTDCYIGHTIQPLRKRFSGHWNRRNHVGCDSCSSAMLFRNYGRDGLEIVLIHELELAGREEALREERRLYEENKASAVNKIRPLLTTDERNDRWKSRREYMKEYMKGYHEARKDKDNTRRKEYHMNHKEEQNHKRAERRAYDAGLKYFARITVE